MQNLNARMARELEGYFKADSATSGRLSNDYDFTGAKTVRVLTPLTVALTDYDRNASANRYGTPSEMDDIVQELTLTQDKSFSITVDRGNLEDQEFVKNARAMLALEIRERAVPEFDKYVLAQLAQKGGKIVGSSTAASTSNICELISAGTLHLDDSEVPNTDRSLYVSASVYKLLKHSTEFLAVESVAKDAIRKGVVGMYDGMDVIKVPSARWPKFVNFMIVHKSAAVAPVKMADSKIHLNPPGISGNLIEGRQYYDLFVFGVKCDGVYIHVDTGSNRGTVCADPSITASGGAISCSTTGATIKYTTDGTDPRYSPSAKTGTQSDVAAAGTVVKAYAFKAADGFYPSAVATATLT